MQDWIKDAEGYKRSVRDVWRGRPIEFLGDYMFEWNTYKEFKAVENGVFKYCITEVK